MANNFPDFYTPTVFNLTKDDFETLVAYFTPKDDILKILGTNIGSMENWCRENYGMKFDEVYDTLLALARVQGRMMITRLANAGNNTAMGIFSKHFAKYEEEQSNKTDTIPIIAVIPLPEKNDGNIDK